MLAGDGFRGGATGPLILLGDDQSSADHRDECTLRMTTAANLARIFVSQLIILRSVHISRRADAEVATPAKSYFDGQQTAEEYIVFTRQA